MNVDKLCAVSRAVDAVICWSLAPKWCRGKLRVAVRKAYNRPQDAPTTDRSTCAYA